MGADGRGVRRLGRQHHGRRGRPGRHRRVRRQGGRRRARTGVRPRHPGGRGRVRRGRWPAAGPAGDRALGTGRCLVLVTEDAERTMATHLGAATTIGPADVPVELVARGRIVYLEGYLWDLPPAKEAMRRAIGVAHRHDGSVALSLSDPFCVERHQREFLDLLLDDVDVLFGNEEEIIAAVRRDVARRGARGRRGDRPAGGRHPGSGRFGGVDGPGTGRGPGGAGGRGGRHHRRRRPLSPPASSTASPTGPIPSVRPPRRAVRRRGHRPPRGTPAAGSAGHGRRGRADLGVGVAGARAPPLCRRRTSLGFFSLFRRVYDLRTRCRRPGLGTPLSRCSFIAP